MSSEANPKYFPGYLAQAPYSGFPLTNTVQALAAHFNDFSGHVGLIEGNRFPESDFIVDVMVFIADKNQLAMYFLVFVEPGRDTGDSLYRVAETGLLPSSPLRTVRASCQCTPLKPFGTPFSQDAVLKLPMLGYGPGNGNLDGGAPYSQTYSFRRPLFAEGDEDAIQFLW